MIERRGGGKAVSQHFGGVSRALRISSTLAWSSASHAEGTSHGDTTVLQMLQHLHQIPSNSNVLQRTPRC
jgi:hypothetical protein